jgi:hypothetical protein
MAARYDLADADPLGPALAQDNPWLGRFDARDLRHPAPWTISDLKDASRDFLGLEAQACAESGDTSADVRLAALVALGALAAISINGTTGPHLEWAVSIADREVSTFGPDLYAWLSEIATQTNGDLHVLARDGHRLLGHARRLRSDRRASSAALASAVAPVLAVGVAEASPGNVAQLVRVPRGRPRDADSGVERFVNTVREHGKINRKALVGLGFTNPSDLYRKAKERSEHSACIERVPGGREGLLAYRWVGPVGETPPDSAN